MIIRDVPGIPLRRRDDSVIYTLVDPEDFVFLNQWVWSYYNGYANRWGRVDGRIRRKVRMHRVLMGVGEGDLDVDHINCNPLDNRKANLRVVTRAENNQNVRARRGSTSTYRGVWFNARRPTKPWIAEGQVGGRRKRIGGFATEAEAGAAAAAWRAENMPYSIEALQ